MGTRLVAEETNATYRPPGDKDGEKLSPLPGWPVELTEARLVVPFKRSLTNTPLVSSVCPPTSSLAEDWKATNRPSAVIEGA